MKIGVIGVGFVGKAVLTAMGYAHDAVGFDIAIEQYLDTWKEILETQVVFVAVPTLTVDGKQDLGPVETTVRRLAQDNYQGVVCIKCTIVPGTMDKLKLANPKLRLTHNPEFLTARAAFQDLMAQETCMVSGAMNDCVEVVQAYNAVLPRCKYLTTENFKTTELAKYMSNAFLATKVTFCNEFAAMCYAMGASYQEVSEFAISQGLIGENHTQVPGPDGRYGWAGACVTPDTRISTPAGTIRADELAVGVEVLDMSGTTKVTKIGRRVVDETITIFGSGRSLTGSPDHIHFKYENNKLVEVLLQNVKPNDWVFLPTPVETHPVEIALPSRPENYQHWWPEKLSWSSELAYVVGLWLADGCQSPSENAISWTLGLAKTAVKERLITSLTTLGLNPSERFVETEGTYGISRVWVVRVRSLALKVLLARLAVVGNSHTKRFPKVPTEYVMPCVAGWLDGDGSVDGGSVTGFSRSTNLILDIDNALLRCGICASISKEGQQINISMRESVQEILKHTTRLEISADRYVRETPYASPNKRKVLGGWCVKVKQVAAAEGSEVVSVETESGRYIANNFLTHNCFPKDVLAIITAAEERGVDTKLLSMVWHLNGKYRKFDNVCREKTP